jgi:hypothetical protein
MMTVKLFAGKLETTPCDKGVMMSNDIIGIISPEQALAILRRLAGNNPEIRKEIEDEAHKCLKEIDVEDICEEVYSALDGILQVSIEGLEEKSTKSKRPEGDGHVHREGVRKVGEKWVHPLIAPP